jgi:hypothetical protein
MGVNVGRNVGGSPYFCEKSRIGGRTQIGFPSARDKRVDAIQSIQRTVVSVAADAHETYLVGRNSKVQHHASTRFAHKLARHLVTDAQPVVPCR